MGRGVQGEVAAHQERALAHAGVKPEDIDYINTHGTSTWVGDVSEVQAMRKVFTSRRPAYSSTKGYTGHTVSAAGTLEAIYTWTMLREGWIAPCMNVDSDGLDPSFEDYPPIMEPTDKDLQLALSNSLGFGGTNATLVLARS